ncbi:hypothetical protein AVEN_155231-1, partial [Araneus ventricosus]
EKVYLHRNGEIMIEAENSPALERKKRCVPEALCRIINVLYHYNGYE